MAYRVLNVDYQQMGKLASALRDASAQACELVKQMQREVDELGKTWKGPNHDAFVAYFEERIFWVEAYTTSIDFFGYQAKWVEGALNLYQVLEADVDAQVKARLSSAG